MKKYRVSVSANAKANLLDYYEHASKHAPRTADRWYDRFDVALQTLSTLPQRWPVASESEIYPEQIRQMLFGKGTSVYRVLFTIVEDEITVLHIRRSTMDTASLDELLGN